MSGLKNPHVAQFNRLLRWRLGSVSAFCAQHAIGRAHLSNMLNESPDAVRGAYTWRKVKPLVTRGEWRELEQCPAWNNFARRMPARAAEVLALPCLGEKPAVQQTDLALAS